MDADEVRGGQQLVLRDHAHADRLAALRGQVLAPGDDVHAESQAQPGDPATEPAQPDDSESRSVQVGSHGGHPAPGSHAGQLGGKVTSRGEDQSPRQLGRSVGDPASAADDDAELITGVEIDRCVVPAGRDQKAEMWKPREKASAEGGPLAHGDDHREGCEPIRQSGFVVDVIRKDMQIDPTRKPRPRTEGLRHTLVVVEHGHRDRVGTGSSHERGVFHARGGATRFRYRWTSGPSRFAGSLCRFAGQR